MVRTKNSFLQAVMSFPINTLFGRQMVTIFSSASAAKPSLPSPICFRLRSALTTPLLQIAMGVLSVEDVDYSPDGIWIAYESGGDRGYHVLYSTPSGANQARITEDVTFDDFDPAWRPTPKQP